LRSRIFAIVTAGVVAWLALTDSASAELVFFASGRTLSVKGHRIEGDSIVLFLREGGEVVWDAAQIARIAPDEVPHPDPAVAGDGAAGALSFAPFAEIIDRTAAVHRVDPTLVRAMIQVESAYRPEARSRKGAMGLMQLMPEIARRYEVADPYEPAANIEAGVKHLKTLLERYAVPLALAAYNAGETAVERYGGIPPFRETQDYVRQVLALARLAASPR
jgi:soluble lytic murein transglycosylase-like protein